jgi:hypothetical protein
VTPAERVETGKATAEAMIRGPSRPVRFGSVRFGSGQVAVETADDRTDQHPVLN